MLSFMTSLILRLTAMAGRQARRNDKKGDSHTRRQPSTLFIFHHMLHLWADFRILIKTTAGTI